MNRHIWYDKQLAFEGSCFSFGGYLRRDNRWVKLSELIPWKLVEDIYVSKLQNDFGAPAHSARMAFGSLLIKEQLGLSDEEAVTQITENPYLQYFIGLKEFQKEAPFDASQLAYFRKRFSPEAVNRINEAIATAQARAELKETNDFCSTDDTPPEDTCFDQRSKQEQPEEKTKNQGELFVDATCTPGDVTYSPTDLELLNKAREKAEKILRRTRTNEETKSQTLFATKLVKSYNGRRVVDNINLEINRGEVVGLLGPNGAGKTTTFYMIVGLAQPDGGRVLLNGEDISLYPMYMRARRGINYLPQEASVFRKLTVEENIMAVLETLYINKGEREKRLQELLKELDLTGLAKNMAYSLSGGERRRVEITRALVTSPQYMLLDEPFAGIDPIAVADIQDIIRTLRSKGIGVLISDHNVRETLKVCDRAYIVNEGTILVEGDPDSIARSEIARRIYLGKDFDL